MKPFPLKLLIAFIMIVQINPNQWGAHINGAALFDKDVFFLVNQGNLNLIYHGKLN